MTTSVSIDQFRRDPHRVIQSAPAGSVLIVSGDDGEPRLKIVRRGDEVRVTQAGAR